MRRTVLGCAAAALLSCPAAATAASPTANAVAEHSDQVSAVWVIPGARLTTLVILQSFGARSVGPLVGSGARREAATSLAVAQFGCLSGRAIDREFVGASAGAGPSGSPLAIGLGGELRVRASIRMPGRETIHERCDPSSRSVTTSLGEHAVSVDAAFTAADGGWSDLRLGFTRPEISRRLQCLYTASGLVGDGGAHATGSLGGAPLPLRDGVQLGALGLTTDGFIAQRTDIDAFANLTEGC